MQIIAFNTENLSYKYDIPTLILNTMEGGGLDQNRDFIKIAAGLLKFSRDTLKGRFPIPEVWSVVHGARRQAWAHSIQLNSTELCFSQAADNVLEASGNQF